MNAPAHITPAYTHYPKQARPQGVLRTGASILKFYHLETDGEPVPAPVANAARAFLTDEGGERTGSMAIMVSSCSIAAVSTSTFS